MSFADVISIERTNENFRLIYDIKGRFAVHRITPEEAKVTTGFSVSFLSNAFCRYSSSTSCAVSVLSRLAPREFHTSPPMMLAPSVTPTP
jgi:hypothetical protein